jgi:hypothetical protein
MTQQPPHAPPAEGAERSVPPVRWPHLGAGGALVAALWCVGMVVGLVVPAFIAAPMAKDQPASQIWLALVVTHIGALILLAAGFVARRRGAALIGPVICWVSAISVSTCGFLIAGAMFKGL